jgi:beta-galactosidase
VTPPPAVAAAEPFAKVGGWRISPPQTTRPDPTIAPSHGDMNSWGWGEPPIKQEPESQAWRAYRASFAVREDRNDGHRTVGERRGRARSPAM